MAPKAALTVLGLCLALGVVAADRADDASRKKEEGWFCPKGKDCPLFKVEHDESPAYQLRHYSRSTWAVSCAHDVQRPAGVFRATASVLKYIKENDLWGGAPLAHALHVSLDCMGAWNASAQLGSLQEGGAENCLHKTICAAYYLPSKYQSAEGSTGTSDVDRRPPKPGRDSGVRVVRVRGFDGYVAGFPGFPTPPRFIFTHMRLVRHLKWAREPFHWQTAAFFVYNGPTEIERRWNEVLIPAGHEGKGFDELLMEGEDLFAVAGDEARSHDESGVAAQQ